MMQKWCPLRETITTDRYHLSPVPDAERGFWVFCPNSNHGYRKYLNLAKDKTPTRSNELFFSDITYIRSVNDFSYRSLITDSYSHKIVGWHLSENLSNDGPVKALEMALLNRRKDKAAKLPLMHHSDRGIQCCSRAYVALLEKRNVTISMSRASYLNPVAERINGILKTELLRDTYPTHEEALATIAHAIDICNN
jgi:transposase InsO family protein